LFATLPVVLTQAWTAQNDLVVAAFLGTAAYFVLGEERSDIVLAGAATALAIGTKFTAVLALPVLVLVLVAAGGPNRRAKAGWMLGLGAVGGSPWYVVNLLKTGHFDGGLAQNAGQTANHSVLAVLRTFWAFLVQSFDLSGLPYGTGVIGLDWLLFPAAGLALLVVIRRREGRGQSSWKPYATGLLVVATPSLVALSHWLLYTVGKHWPMPALGAGANTAAGATPSWYGPVSPLLLTAGVIVAVIAIRQGHASPVVAVLALSPLVLLMTLALTVVWDPWRGRFLIFAFVLATASWSLMLQHRWLARSVTTLAVLVMITSLANAQSKPSGLWPIQVGSNASVWGKPDWWAQTILRPGEDDRTVLKFAELRIPHDAAVAIAPRGNELLSPYFGRDLKRSVELVRNGERVGSATGWLIAAPGVRPMTCNGSWRLLRRTSEGWRIARRVRPDAACSAHSSGSVSASSRTNPMPVARRGTRL
jgi:hypothetical protein